jgi:nitroreductase
MKLYTAVNQNMTMRQILKQKLSTFPIVWSTYQVVKVQVKRLWLLTYFLRDIMNVYRNMYWPLHLKSNSQLTSELLFQFHKIEKGLVMPGPRRFFGQEPARAVINLLNAWDLKGLPLGDPVYLGALETLHAYKERLQSESLDKDDKVLSYVQSFLINHPTRTRLLATPHQLVSMNSDIASNPHRFDELVSIRRSVRSFTSMEVPREIIKHAVGLAQLSPSACNRQPCRVYLITDDIKKNALLALQNGNNGFGHSIPALAVITSDSAAFFDASERHEPYVDGGLFSMTLMYALSAHGLATCCLNWCVSPDKDVALRNILPLADSEVVIMLMAIGYPEPNVLVPRSPRKSTDNVLIEVF